jgi:hypothetical protein
VRIVSGLQPSGPQTWSPSARIRCSTSSSHATGLRGSTSRTSPVTTRRIHSARHENRLRPDQRPETRRRERTLRAPAGRCACERVHGNRPELASRRYRVRYAQGAARRILLLAVPGCAAEVPHAGSRSQASRAGVESGRAARTQGSDADNRRRPPRRRAIAFGRYDRLTVSAEAPFNFARAAQRESRVLGGRRPGTGIRITPARFQSGSSECRELPDARTRVRDDGLGVRTDRSGGCTQLYRHRRMRGEGNAHSRSLASNLVAAKCRRSGAHPSGVAVFCRSDIGPHNLHRSN